MKRNKMGLLGLAALSTLGLAALSGPVTAQDPLLAAQDAAQAAQNAQTVGALDAALKNAAKVSDFFAALPDWDRTVPVKKAQSTSDATTADDKAQQAKRTHHSIAEDPTQIVAYQPVEGFWLGALVQGKGIDSIGTLHEIRIPAEKRAPFRVSTDLAISHSYKQINAPSFSAVDAAIHGMMQAANAVPTGSSFTLKVVDNFDTTQTALALGLNANFMAEVGDVDIKSSLNTKHDATHHSVTAAFTQKAFTVKADFGGRTGATEFFNDGFTAADAKELAVGGQVGGDNPPAYVNAITYGRVVLVTVTSSVSEDELNAALKASYNGAVLKADASVESNSKLKNAHYEVTATQIGGKQDSFAALSPAEGADGYQNMLGVINRFLQQPAEVSTMVPISYQLNTVKENRVAAIPLTTEYDTVQYPAAGATGSKYKLKLWVTIEKGGVANTDNDVSGEVDIDGEPYWLVSSDLPICSVHQGATVPMSDDPDSTHIKKPFDQFVQSSGSMMKPVHLTVVLHSGSDVMGAWNLDINNLKGTAAATADRDKNLQVTRTTGLGLIQVDQFKVTLHYKVIKGDDIF